MPQGHQSGFRGTRSARTKQALEQEVEDLRAQAEWEQLQAQLFEAQKMEAIGTLAGGIAHDFNNILGIMLGYTELTLMDVPHTSVVHTRLMKVLNAGKRARDLVRQILTFSRRSDQQRQSIHIPAIIDEALMLLRATLPATIDIRPHIETTAGTVLADPTQIHQVFMNLCTNAEHAMRETGGAGDTLQQGGGDGRLSHHSSLPGAGTIRAPDHSRYRL